MATEEGKRRNEKAIASANARKAALQLSESNTNPEADVKLVENANMILPMDQSNETIITDATPPPTNVTTDPNATQNGSTDIRTDEERAKSLLDQQQQDRYNLGQDLFGESLNPEYSSLQAQVDDFIKKQDKDKKLAELSTGVEISAIDQKIKDIEESAGSQKAATRERLAITREGPQSGTNLSVSEKIQSTIQRRAELAIRELDAAKQQRTAALENLKEAQRSGRSDLVSQYQSALDNAELAIQKADSDYLNALTAQQSSQIQIQAATRANYETFKGLVETGTTLDTNALIGIAKSLDLDFEVVNSYYEGAQAVRDDKSLSIEEKNLKLTQLADDVDAQLRGVSSKEARKVDDFLQLAQSGNYTMDQLQSFAVAMDIPNEQNPIYQADLKVKQAEAKIAQAEASGQIINPKDLLDYADALYDYKQKTGQGIGYVPEGGGTVQTSAVQTEDGIRFGFADNPNGVTISSSTRVLTQCGQFVNDVLGTKMGDDYSTKYAYVDKSILVPEPGMGFVYPTNAPEGHTGIVEYYNPDTHMVGVADVNGLGDNKARHREIPLSQIMNGGGLFNPPNGVPIVGSSGESSDFTPSQVLKFNNSDGTAPKNYPGGQQAFDQAFNSFQSKITDQNTPILDVLPLTTGKKALSQELTKSLEKSVLVSQQLDTLQESIDGLGGGKLAPITGYLRGKNPFDIKAQELNAIITSMVPNLARGVYGEVGVLTDRDVALYTKTLPNLAQPEEVRQFVTDLTKTVLARGLENKLRAYAATYDVSGYSFIQQYLPAETQQAETNSGWRNQADTKINSGVDDIN